MKKLISFLAIGMVLLLPAALAQTTTTLSVVVGPEASITVSSPTNLTTPGSFANYTGTTSFTYKIRTSTGGSIVLQPAAEIAGSGPKLANLSYAPSVTAPGTAATPDALAVGSSSAVATFGANAHSALAGNSGSVSWSLVNDPSYATGTYTVDVTFTISAT